MFLLVITLAWQVLVLVVVWGGQVLLMAIAWAGNVFLLAAVLAWHVFLLAVVLAWQVGFFFCRFLHLVLPLLVSLLHLIALHSRYSGHPLCPPIVGSFSEIYQGLAVRHRHSDLKDLRNVPRHPLRNGQDAKYKEDLLHLQEIVK